MSSTLPGPARWLAVPVAGLLAAGLVAAVVLNNRPPVGPEHVAFIATSPDRVQDARSATFTLARRFSDGTTTVVIRQEGIADVRGRRAQFTITVQPSGQPPQGPVVFLLDGDTVYLGLPPSRSIGLTEGKRWLMTTLFDRSDAQLTSATPDPMAYFDTLAGVGRNVKRVGKETLAGILTTHYRLTATLRTAAARLSEQRQREVAPTIATLGPDPLPVEAWIDRQGRPRKMTVNLDTELSRGLITVEVHDYGTPLELDLPDESDTLEVESLAAALALAGIV